MHKDTRIKFLLVIFLIVFLLAFSIILQGITQTPPAPDQAPSEESSEVDSDKEISFSGTIFEIQGNDLSLIEASPRTIVIPGGEFEEEYSQEIQNTFTASLTDQTVFSGITREDLTEQASVTLVAREVSSDPPVYEVVSIQKQVLEEM